MKFDTFTSTINEKKGLWANMHARRKAGKPKRKPGDKNYPKTLNVSWYQRVQHGQERKERINQVD